MRRALALARRAWGDTHPNPMVGALLVRDGRVVGEGWHARAGGPHAEVVALREAGELARGATLIVTLEPCSTHGRTPPCTDAILAAGVAGVVVGTVDPNPAHAGNGLDLLRQAGVEVVSGILGDECADLNLIFNHWIVHRQPLFAAKVATTLCGRIATRSGHSQWITGAAAREDVHRWRRYFPAIATGSGTVLADNPHLTARLPELDQHCPRRFVMDRSLSTVLEPLPHVYGDAYRERTTVVTREDAPAERERVLRAQGVGVLRLPASSDQEAFAAFRAHCLAQGIEAVLFEGGGRLTSALLEARPLDYLLAYRAPVILADEAAVAPFSGAAPDFIQQGWRLEDVRHAIFGDDQLLRGRLRF